MASVTKSSSPALRFAGFDDEWETHAFSDLVDFRGHNSLSRADLTEVPTSAMNIHYGDILVKYDSVVDVSQTDIPFVRDVERLSNVSRQSLSDGDVLFADAAEDSTVGKCVEVQGISDNLVLAGLHTISARPVRAFALGFLGHALNAPSFHNQLLSKMQGTKVSSISISTLTESDFSFPPEGDEQRAIGELFADLDALIEQHRAKHANLQQTKSALMQRMFPQDGADEPELRLGGFSGAWGKVSFDSLLTRVEIGTNILGSNRYHGIPLLKMGNIQRGYFDFSSFERLPDNAELPSDSLVRTGDFLFNTRNTMELVGKGATWMGESGAFAFNGNIARFTLERVDTRFFNYLYNHPRSIRDVSKCATGTTSVAAIYPRSLKSVRFQIPSLEEQRAIGGVFADLDALIAAEHRYITQLAQAKTALLQRMFV